VVDAGYVPGANALSPSYDALPSTWWYTVARFAPVLAPEPSSMYD